MNFIDAMESARKAHRGQIDKGGKPYIEHPMRVAWAVRGSEDAMVVAILHDVLEDTDFVLVGLTKEQEKALDAISRREDEGYFDYIDRCGANPLARRVKLADLYDNLSPARLFALPAGQRRSMGERYKQAVEKLTNLTMTTGGVGWPE